MKLVFAGPSLSGIDKSAFACRFLPPAAQGDLARAVVEGATVIGLIDGVYETTAAVWHKEILFALQQGVAVLGGASMGALRAAECAPFGMRAVGSIATRYLAGELDDDAAVAVVHGPAELDYLPLNEALVDAEATIARLRRLGLVAADEADRLVAAARAIFFKRRTAEAIAEQAIPDPSRRAEILAAYAAEHQAQKRADALQVVEEVLRLPARRAPVAAGWTLSEPAFWKAALREIGAAPAAGGGKRLLAADL
ncbi:MAG TPA: TfuA-like protein [Devosia sp.]|nr:TfuA-like protein [Devosia sp.]